jgi:hypothetical protein
MDDELRMKVADLGSPEALADCIIGRYFDIEIPVPLEQIAYAVGHPRSDSPHHQLVRGRAGHR